MVQVRIEIEFNVDLVEQAMVPGVYQGKVFLNTAMGERHSLYSFSGTGDIQKAKDVATEWVNENMLEFRNPSCRPLRYLKVAEQ